MYFYFSGFNLFVSSTDALQLVEPVFIHKFQHFSGWHFEYDHSPTSVEMFRLFFESETKERRYLTFFVTGRTTHDRSDAAVFYFEDEKIRLYDGEHSPMVVPVKNSPYPDDPTMVLSLIHLDGETKSRRIPCHFLSSD